MELRQLDAMKLIVASGSFQVAAKRLSLTKSALSHQMRALEEELGEQLLVRARPKIYPTPAGQRLLHAAERIFAEVSAVKEELGAKASDKVAGTIRIAGTHIAITYVYGDLIESFVSRHRAVDIVFHATELTEDSVTRVLQRSADVGFAVLPQSHPKLIVTPMVSAEQVFVVGRTHPLAKARTVTIKQLQDWPFVRFEQRTGQRIVSDKVFGAGNYPRILAESNDVEYVKRIIRMGLGGVALMPGFCVRKELAEGTVRALRLQDRRIMQDAGFVSRSDVKLRALALFREECIRMRGRAPRLLSLERLADPVFESAGAAGSAKRRKTHRPIDRVREET